MVAQVKEVTTEQVYSFDELYRAVFPDLSGFPGRAANNPAPTHEQVLSKLSDLLLKQSFNRDSSRAFFYLQMAGLIHRVHKINNVNTKHGRYARVWFTLDVRAVQFRADLQRKAHAQTLRDNPTPPSMIANEPLLARDEYNAEWLDALALREADDDRRAEMELSRYGGAL